MINQATSSLITGTWFKLICGASYQHLPSVRNITLAYTLAGADCIDVAADPAVIKAASEGIAIANDLGKTAQAKGFLYRQKPLLMVSLNDGEDPHFRKAFFNSSQCPNTCPRPCEQICPAKAINFSGVITDQCYGCGRCLPICPSNIIETQALTTTVEEIASSLTELGVDALEIHTQLGRNVAFEKLWRVLSPYSHQLQVLAISCPDGDNLFYYLNTLAEMVSTTANYLIWQMDGRPMSGDIGHGTTHATIKLAAKVLKYQLPGFIQLAGGTNNYTVSKLKAQELLKTSDKQPKSYIAGVAYGSYARSLIMPILEELETISPHSLYLENYPSLLWQAVSKAHDLVYQLKAR